MQGGSGTAYNRLLSGKASVQLVTPNAPPHVDYLPTRLNTSAIDVDFDYAEMLCLDAAAATPSAYWNTQLMTASAYENEKLHVAACASASSASGGASTATSSQAEPLTCPLEA